MDLDLAQLEYEAGAKPVTPMAIRGKWREVIAAGGVDDADAGTITNPETEITDSTRRLIRKDGAGTYLALRLGYDDTPSTDPVVKLFGRHSEDEPWELVPNRNGDLSQALEAAGTDVSDGTLKYTTVDPDLHVYDVGGFGELVVGIETALAGTNAADAIIQARLWG